MIHPYDAGHDARLAGEPIQSNPYITEKDRWWWSRGWAKAITPNEEWIDEMKRWKLLFVLMFALLPVSVSAQCVSGKCRIVTSVSAPTINSQGFNLAPGERLISVNGQAVAAVGVVTGGGVRSAPSPSSTDGDNVPDGRIIINRDPVAFEHAKREAKLIASYGANYHRGPGRGHPLGCAPGCRYSGTGYTWDRNRPGHCYENELPTSRIVARARATDGQGRWFWHASYR